MRHHTASTTCLALLLTACSVVGLPAATVSPAAAKIQVHLQISTALDTCKKIGPIVAKYDRRPFVNSDPYLQAQLREETVKLGGDSVVLMQREVIGPDAVWHGTAYKCFQ